MANEIKLLFSFFLSYRAKTEKNRGARIPRDLRIRRNRNFYPLHSPLCPSLPGSLSLSRLYLILSYAFHASFPEDYSKDIGGSFLLEADASEAAASAALYRAAYK